MFHPMSVAGPPPVPPAILGAPWARAAARGRQGSALPRPICHPRSTDRRHGVSTRLCGARAGHGRPFGDTILARGAAFVGTEGVAAQGRIRDHVFDRLDRRKPCATRPSYMKIVLCSIARRRRGGSYREGVPE